MGLIAKPRTTRTFPPHALTLEQILADLDAPHLFDPFDPFSFSPCAEPSSVASTATPIATPDPAFSYTTWLQSQSQMMPAPGGGAPPPPLPPNKPTGPSGPCSSNPTSSAKSQPNSTPTSSSSPTRRPRKKPRKESSVRFPCPKCPSTFSRKDNLATHARVHTGERPYTCRFCARKFMWPSSARTHELTHLRNQRKQQGRAPVSQPRVAPQPQRSAPVSEQTQPQAQPQNLRQHQNRPLADSSAEQAFAQAQRSEQVVGNQPRMPPVQAQSSLQQPTNQFQSVDAVNQLGFTFATGSVKHEMKTEDIPRIPRQEQRSSEVQGQQHPSAHVVAPRWSGPIDAVTGSVSLPPQVPAASASSSQRVQIPFPHQQTLGYHASSTRGTAPSAPVVPPVANARPSSLGMASLQASANEADVDPVHAGVLATIEGLIGNAGSTSHDNVEGQTSVGVSEGINPIFGETVGTLSQNELERHMEAIFSGDSRHDDNDSSGEDER